MDIAEAAARGSNSGEDSEHVISMVEIKQLNESDSPRLDGVSIDHVRTLAERADELPPIIVHRRTMRVVDGMHRLRAAMLCGRSRIAVRYFSGSETESFILAVRSNIEHGLPLSLADRTVAATRIMSVHPEWSDRKIATLTGLAHQTIGEIRRRATGESDQLHRRVGSDGKSRPLNSARARKFAAELIASDSSMSLRQLAKAAGISTGTARDVRNRVRRGDDPVPPNQRLAESRDSPSSLPPGLAGRPMPADDVNRILWTLRNDPSLRFTETGKRLLRLLGAYPMVAAECDALAKGVPEHSRKMVAEIARAYLSIWHEFAMLVDGP
jgi:hypothetical protein